jgi:hypothetical protein
MNVNNKPKWQLASIVDFGDKPVIKGKPQFGFHVHTGECYHLFHYEQGYIGQIENDHLAWTAGETDPNYAGTHFFVKLVRPKYISKAFHSNTLLIAEEQCVYAMDIATNQFRQLISKDKAGICDMGNCVFDRNDDIWINDIKGCRVYHFDSKGALLETLGKKEAGFQQGTVPFEEVLFNWIYDLRLGADGNIYVLDSKNYAVRKIDISKKMVTTICGDGIGGNSGDGGSAELARLGTNSNEYFDGPWALSIDEQNNIFIGDTQNHAVRMIEGATNTIHTILPNESCRDLVFEKICSMDYCDKRLYIPDWRNNAPRTLIVAEQMNTQS